MMRSQVVNTSLILSFTASFISFFFRMSVSTFCVTQVGAYALK